MRAVAWAALLSAGCGEPPPSDEVFLAIARDYPRYRLASPSANWAPERCASITLSLDAPAGHVSASADAGTHGRKLYYLHARDEKAYRAGGEQPRGQVLVKESWTPREVPEEEARRVADASPHKYLQGLRNELPSDDPWKGRPARRGGRHYVPGEKAELFVMAKLGTSGSDAGWVYATLSADGKRVTSSGALESCVACHREAKTDRIFGLPAD